MSYTTTSTDTFTRSNARHVASKVAADLKLMQLFCGGPSDEMILMYEIELLELLAGKYLDKVTYGYKRNGAWVVALRYQAHLDGTLNSDDRAGKVSYLAGKDVRGASEASFLEYTSAWMPVSASDRERIYDQVGFRRATGTEPATANGYWQSDKTYSSGAGGVARSTFRTF